MCIAQMSREHIKKVFQEVVCLSPQCLTDMPVFQDMTVSLMLSRACMPLMTLMICRCRIMTGGRAARSPSVPEAGTAAGNAAETGAAQGARARRRLKPGARADVGTSESSPSCYLIACCGVFKGPSACRVLDLEHLPQVPCLSPHLVI